MAVDPKTWTVKTQEAFAAAVDQARALANPELTPDHILVAITSQEGTVVTPLLAKLGQAPAMVRERAQEAVDRLDDHLNHDPEPEPSVWLWKAVCKYGLGLFKEAEECAFRGPQGLRLARTSLLKCPAQTSQRAAFEWRHC